MARDLEQFLGELCVQLGYCLPEDEREKLLTDPPRHADDFTDRVLRAEGLDPVTVRKAQRQELRGAIARYLDRHDP